MFRLLPWNFPNQNAGRILEMRPAFGEHGGATLSLL